MLIIQNISYIHPDKDILFDNINFTISKKHKIALIGNNGAGKSTLLKIIAGVLQPSAGSAQASATPYYIPQIFGQFNHLTVAQALCVQEKLSALHEILDGNVTEKNISLLNDDWTIEERCHETLDHWKLNGISLSQKMETLSGGQKTKVFLAGISIHQPEIILLDEPSNHLDTAARELLYALISSYSGTLIIVSHDRKLLNMIDETYELSNRGITIYGGNYDLYAGQKVIENNALNEDVKSKEKALRKVKETERDTAERQQKLDARGKKKQEKASVPTIMMNTLRNNAEKSTSRIKNIHAKKTGSIAKELNNLRKELPDTDKMKFGFDDSPLHLGKILVDAKNIDHTYGKHLLWKDPLNFTITSGERIALKGENGSGKTTLIKIILGTLDPDEGAIQRSLTNAVYIDQDYLLIDNGLTVYEQAERFNFSALQEHEINIRLNWFLFTKEFWNKRCATLSGGEKMRLMLCCLTIGQQAPDMIILDEPTNNLDIQNIQILIGAIKDYKGTLIVVSHDEDFLEQINIQRMIRL